MSVCNCWECKIRSQIGWDGFAYFLLVCSLFFQTYYAGMESLAFRGIPIFGAFTELPLVALYAGGLGGPVAMLFMLPIIFFYYFIIFRSCCFIVSFLKKGKKWITIFLCIPILLLVLAREYNILYGIAYHQTYRDMISEEKCAHLSPFQHYLCRRVVARNLYQRTHIDYCDTIKDRIYFSYCVHDVASFTKNIFLCGRIGNPDDERSCMEDLVHEQNLSREQACSVFQVGVDRDTCLDVFLEKTQDWKICDQMTVGRERCQYFMNQYYESIKNQGKSKK